MHQAVSPIGLFIPFIQLALPSLHDRHRSLQPDTLISGPLGERGRPGRVAQAGI